MKFCKKLILLLSVFLLTVSLFSPALAENDSAVVSFADLKGLKAAVKDGSIQDTILQSLVEDPQLFYFKTLADECIALQQGKVDYAFVIREQYSAIAEAYEDLSLVPQLSSPCGEIGCIFAKTADGDRLREEVNLYLSEIRESGELKALQDYWFTPGAKRTVEIPAKGENGVLTAATGAVSPPFVYLVEESVNGFEAELLANFCRARGYGLRFEIMDLGGILPAVSSGKCDLAVNCITNTAERAEQVNFSETTSTPEYTILMRSGMAAQFGAEEASGAGSGKGFFEKLTESFRKTFLVENRWKLILRGCGTTLLITLLSACLGIFLGLPVYRLRESENSFFRKLASVFNAIMGGTPMVVLLMIFYYVIFGRITIPAAAVAVIAFGLNLSSSMSEIYAACIDAIDPGQMEAALALGYSRRRAFRRFIFPQALLRALPLIKGQIIALLKGTAIVGFISVQDLTKMGDLIRSRTYEAFFPLIAVAILYFILGRLIRAAADRLEKQRDPVRRRDRRLARQKEETGHE